MSGAASPAALPGFFAVVPAGGAGTRLWPLSRAGAPKFLLDLTGAGESLLQGTWRRLEPLCGADGLLLVTGTAHADAVAGQLPALRPENLLLEPSPRESMAAIGLAAAVLARRHGEDVVLGSFAADHVIADRPAGPDGADGADGADGSGSFAEVVRQAVATARAGHVVTIGIEPTGPATGFGYIAAGAPLGVAGAPLAQQVEQFVEKPDAVRAAAYLATGRYRWNAGMFVVQVGVLLGHLAAQLPTLHDGLREVAASWDEPGRRADVLARVWPGLPRIAIDHAIAEPVAAAGGVAVVAGGFAWDDVGDWDSLAALLDDDASRRLAVLGDGALVRGARGATGVVVPASGRAVSVLGIEDAVVVDTPDALLVTTRRHAQAVKEEVAAWRDAGRPELL